MVRDKRAQQPLAYASIGMPGKNAGTVCNADGAFTIDIPDSMPAATMITVSLVGYEPYRTSLKEFSKLKEILLVKQAANTKAGSKVALKRKQVLGNTSRVADLRLGFINDKVTHNQRPGYEIGALMNTNGRLTAIDSLFLNFVQCSYERLFFRVNVYQKVKDSFVNIMPRAYYVHFTKAEALHGVRVDLRELQLRVNNDFLVSLELVQPLLPGALLFAAGYSGNKGYIRNTSQEQWLKLPMNAGVGIGVWGRN